jgi:hypothetical protein
MSGSSRLYEVGKGVTAPVSTGIPPRPVEFKFRSRDLCVMANAFIVAVIAKVGAAGLESASVLGQPLLTDLAAA